MAVHTSSSCATKLTVTPSVALVDDVVNIRVTGLHSKQQVTLAATVKESGESKKEFEIEYSLGL